MKKKDWLWVLIPLALVIFIDQFSKSLALKSIHDYSYGLLHFSLHFNRGAMLGLFSDLPPVLRIVSLSTGGAFLLFSFIIIQYLLPTRSMILRMGMSILIGGILGNVIDRTLWGHVVDFLIIGNRKLSTGVFNLADVLQWLGYFMMGYAMIKDREKLWPKNNLRKHAWIDPKFQLRYCFIMVVCGLGFSLIAGVFSYTFIKFIVIGLVGQNQKMLDQFLIPFVFTFSIVSLSFTAFLFMIGKQLSHRIVGPVYAFERFVQDYIDGKTNHLKLRTGDEFKQLERVAETIAKELQSHEHNRVIPLLPFGKKVSEEPLQQEKSV